ncbi:MAG: lamin tail domain-containing protein, partial [Sciscionella sp.]
MTLRSARPHALLGAAAATLALGMTVALATPADAASAVHFGRIQYDSPGKDTRSNASLNAEYVRVVNSSGHSVSLRGWTIRDLAGHMYHFTPSSIAAHQTVVVHTGKGRNTQT